MVQGFISGWVSTDCGRGTSDILWSCLSTIFLCVFTAIHLSIPEYHTNQSGSIRSKVSGSRIVPAPIFVIFPELLVVTAILDCIHARRGVIVLRRLTKSEDVSLTQGFFLNMGGYCLKSPADRYRQLRLKDTEQLAALPEAEELAGQFKAGSEDQINDLAKADSLTKLLACAQALWSVVQTIAWLCEHQAVTLLEVSTTAYVFCAVCAYTAWWKKAPGCTTPIFITCSEDIRISSVSQMGLYRPSHQENSHRLVKSGPT